LAEKKIVPEHDQVIHSVYVEHYEQHEKRTESSEFRHVKEQLHKAKTPCWINNGKCEGHLEVHHFVVEWSQATEVDWEKVKEDVPNLDNPDKMENMMVLCEKHHRHKGFGIHTTPYPIWRSQKYMTEEALDDFERAVKEQLYKDK
jgi:hypothetical protein